MSVRNCPAYAREDGASTHLVVSTVNVQEALPSTWTPEFVKVLSTHAQMNKQVTHPSPALALGHFTGEEIESSRGDVLSVTHGERKREKEALGAKRQRKYWTLLSHRQHCSSISVCSSSRLLLTQQSSARMMRQLRALTVSRRARL